MIRILCAYACAGRALWHTWGPASDWTGFAVWAVLAFALALWAQVVPNIGDHARRERVRRFDENQTRIGRDAGRRN